MGGGATVDQELFLRLAEHFRRAALQQLGEDWVKCLPRLPCTTDELKELPDASEQKDELAVLRLPALMGSTSSEIITYLEVTRTVVTEVFSHRSYERSLQTNLAGILCAARV